MTRSSRILGLFALGSGVCASAAAGQELPSAEIGTYATVSFLADGDETTTIVNLPGGGPRGSAAVYVSFFPRSTVMLEPQLSFQRVSRGDNASSRLGLSGHVAYLVRGTDVGSPYLGARVAMDRFGGNNDSEADFGFGVTLGYRAPVHSAVALRIEGAYLRWPGDDEFDVDLNEFGIRFGVGVVVDRSR